MYIKKFYDMEASEAGASSEETPSIAALMAREGTKSDAEGADYQPVRLSNNGWETNSVKDESPVETTTDNSNNKYDNQSQESDERNSYTTQTEQEEYYESWQDAVINQTPDEVLKALGYDDNLVSFINGLKDVDPKMVGFLNTWKENGNVSGYLKELNTNYAEMPPEDVMRHQLRAEYPKASEAQLDVLYKKEIVEKYGLNSYDEDEVTEGKLLLEAKAEKYREELVRQQQDRLIPQAPDRTQEMMMEQQRLESISNNIINDFNENPYTKEVLSKNAITIGEGADKFTFPIDAQEISQLVLHGDPTGESMFEIKKGANGEEVYVPKSQHQILVATVNKYGEKFITELAKHYKSIGGRAAIDPIDNAKPRETRTPSSSNEEPKTIAGAMAKYGRVSSGGW
jgi:hypothetical protein